MSIQNAHILQNNGASSQEVADCKDSEAGKGSEPVRSRHFPVQNLSNPPSGSSSEESCDISIDRIHGRSQVRASRLQSVTKKVSVSQISKCRSLTVCQSVGNHHRALEKKEAWKRRKIKVNQRSKDRLEKVENKRKKIVRYKTVQTKRENGSMGYMAFACKLEETRKKSRKMEIRYNHWRRKRKEVNKNYGCKIRKRKKRYKSWRGKRRKKKQCNNLSMIYIVLVVVTVVVLVLVEMLVLNHRLILN